MKRATMITNSRIYHLLLIASASLVAATVSFFAGGYIAEAASATPVMGITFKASGALAGFLIVFAALFAAYLKLGVTIPLFKVTVSPMRGNFPDSGNPYVAQLTIMKYASGKQQVRDAAVLWEAGGLTVHLRDIEEDDMVMIVLTDAAGKSWRSIFFSPLCSDQPLMRCEHGSPFAKFVGTDGLQSVGLECLFDRLRPSQSQESGIYPPSHVQGTVARG
jgi:hypothetical protein